MNHLKLNKYLKIDNMTGVQVEGSIGKSSKCY